MVKIFDNIALKDEKKIIRNLRIHDVFYKAKEQIFDHLNDDDDIAILKSGSLEVVKNNYNGSINIIETFHEGDIISLLNIYLKDNSVSLIASEDSTIQLLSYTTIANIDPNDKLYAQFFKNLFLLLNVSIKNKNERINILTKKSIRDKLLNYFNDLSVKSNSRNIYLPISLSFLANFLCVDRSAMSRELGYLKDEGFISIKGRKITLLYR